jgi:DNA-binding transcriptional LysR family regulator
MLENYQIELRHLRYFLVVAEELHFRRAAERLYIAQPGLSRQIKQLEVAIGATLFDRHNRKVQLTPAGVYLREESGKFIKALENTLSKTRMIATGERGKLRLGYIGSAMHGVIPELLLRLKRDYPEIRFSLKEMENRDQLEALVGQEIDLGFVRIDRVPATLVTKAVLEEAFSLVVPEEHPITVDNFTGLEQFKDEPFILFESTYSESYHDKVMQLFATAGFAPKVSHSTVNASSIYRLVANSFGLSIVPNSLTEGFSLPIRFISLAGYAPRTTLSAVWHRNNDNPIMQIVLALI